MTPEITRNRDALMRIVAMLIAAVGMVQGRAVAVLPRHVRLRVLRRLKPAESALRRLIMMAAEGLSVAVQGRRAPPVTGIPRGTGARLGAFPLLDTLQRVEYAAPRRSAPGAGPRISFPGYGDDPVFVPEPPAPSPDDLVDAARLCRRLLVLERGLKDVPAQARRLARWRARLAKAREKAEAAGIAVLGKLARTSPMRPGWPPGYRKRGTLDVDEVLSDCHIFARRLRPPDTG